MKRSAMLALVFLFFASAANAFPSDDEIRALLRQRIDEQHRGVGIVVGVIGPTERRVVSWGTFDGGAKKVAGDTIFEIGSVTKVFTSLLLADAVNRGEVALDDPVSKFLPANVKVPERGGKKITLLDLATHTSGLPSTPNNLVPKDPSNLYADYTVGQLYDFLSSYTLTRDIGSQYEYSNLGVGLLGIALARRAGMDYEALVKSRITGPLGMKDTTITLSSEQKERLAPGHNAEGRRVPNWDLPAFAGAGALRSTANDLLIFLSANLDLRKSPRPPAMAAMLKPRRPTSIPATQVALAWHITTSPGSEIVWHNGGTGGYRSYIGFDPKRRVGVVVLANMFTDTGVDDIGRHLLDASIPLAAPPKQHKEIALDAVQLEPLTGRYELAPGFVLTVTRSGNQLFAQITGQPKWEVFAEGPHDFFYKVVDAQLTFQDGAVVLHQNGRDTTAKRIGDVLPEKERKEIALDPAVLEQYTGTYQLTPNFAIAITRAGNQLFLQATAQPKFPLFAESSTEFFLKVVDAQVTFVVDAAGRATSLVLHQNGADVPGQRVK